MNKFNQYISKFAKKRLDKKLMTLFISFIVLSTVLITCVTLISTTSTLIKNTREMAVQKIEVLNDAIEMELDSLESQAEGLIMNKIVQDYLKNSKTVKSADAVDDIKSAMQMVIDGQPRVKMIELFQEDSELLIFRSDINKYDARFLVRELYNDAIETGHAKIKMLYTNKLSMRGEYTLVIYLPVFSTTRLNQQLGILAIDFDCADLGWAKTNTESEIPFETYLLDARDNYFVVEDISKLGSHNDEISKFKDSNHHTIVDDMLYVYRKVSHWDFYLVGQMKTSYIFSGISNIIVMIMLLVVLIMGIFCLMAVLSVKKMYEPMHAVTRAMDQINETHMDVTLSEDIAGEDFKTLVTGFNNMVVRLSAAMDTIKEEQHQIQLLRFSALQSQIQPHFLYNTLESIHWKAVVLGDKELSKMVKALASYYRIVLSKGKDVITLKEELEHVYNYVTIQNIRYENIIDFTTDIDEKCLMCQIPKMTLQPLIENCIYHGIRIKENHRGKIFVKAELKKSCMEITVEDNGEEMTSEKVEQLNRSLETMDESFGYGVRNVNKRIQLIFGAEYGLRFELSSLNSMGAKVVITLPDIYEKGADYAKSNYC